MYKNQYKFWSKLTLYFSYRKTVNDKEKYLTDFDPKWVTPIKMMWLILGTERCGGTDQIDMILDVHVKVSHASSYVVTPHANLTYATQKGINLKISFERVHFSNFLKNQNSRRGWK
jgi:hypothetical protein